MISQPILSVNNLSLTDSERTLFKDISFELSQGEVLAIMGPSGIGKSMLSKAVAGFLPSDIWVDGSIQLNSSEVAQTVMLQRSQLQRPAVIFQDALKALNPLASVEQQLCLALTGKKNALVFSKPRHRDDLAVSTRICGSKSSISAASKPVIWWSAPAYLYCDCVAW